MNDEHALVNSSHPLKVHIYPADKFGCGFFRLIWAARELQRLGHNVVLEMPDTRHTLQVDVDKDNNPVSVNVPDCDVMVFQRVTHRYLAEAIPLIRAQGVAVVVDLDDDLARIDPNNAAYDIMHPKHMAAGKSQHSWHMLDIACKNATLVTTSTDTLAGRYGSHGRVHILHNRLPRFYFDIPHTDSNMIGYPGALGTHYNDVGVAGVAISRLMNEGYDFITAGDTTGIEKVMGLPRAPIALGPVSVQEWPRTINRMGVGIVPLADTEFNKSKSWLKPLELASLSIPSVYSPRREYMKLNRLGLGLAAQKPKHWYQLVKRLADDMGYRTDIGAQCRAVAETMILEDHVQDWWRAWECAHHIQQGEPSGLGDHRDVLSPARR